MPKVTVRPDRPATAPPPEPAPPKTRRRSRRARASAAEPREFRSLVSPHTLNTPRGRLIYWTVLTCVVVVFTAVFVFPLYWMVTGALKTPEELAQIPPGFFPSSLDFGVYAEAWEQLDLGLFLTNTVVYAGGAWLLTLAFDVSAAYALSKLRPVLGKAVLGMMLSTLMIPPMVILLPAYLTVKELPILGWDLLNTPWAIWLPAAANGFFVFLLKRFFDSIPRELLEAAQIDGASAGRILWSIVLPVSRPILGVVSILSVVNVWKDFVWPLLVLPDGEKMTISVGIASLAARMPQNVMIASLVIASIPTMVVFLLFQRSIMAGLTAGSLKG
ncbi:multiple sugar transport system permease protein [Streptosporangium becharense]|uniref:Multiple sugar transport system permease protein n=1 Tax=Streptosporangium becharense TaxID=1816182 RepID=A0A7W9IMR0_9ACTN|nr:carbohydrate ABC transporter permease [Streptosporangium becharense]MBB2914421.1 multiple sugar transport system permease protein [Streptosporangium becharense]MBB5823547.1 multiple sugar transport system permease protein [Streptosporangium becharense]